MKTLSATLLSIVVYAALATSTSVQAGKHSPPVLMVIGDSLSGAYGINIDEGWVALLQHQLANEGHDYAVINASVSGDTTRTGLGRIDAALQAHKPVIVIVALGGNDGLRGLAFTEIESSLASIIEHSEQSNAQVLLVGVRLPPNYGPEYNQQFAALYRRLSDRFEVPLVPRMLDQVADHRDLLQADGIHPTAEAQPRIMQNVWTGLEPLLQEPADSPDNP
jgi:acyl-CoA thioesterase-1